MTIDKAQDILNRIKYKNARFHLKYGTMGGVDILLRMENKDAFDEDYNTARFVPIHTRDVIDEMYFFDKMSEEDFVSRIFQMCQRMKIHELHEFFKYDNKYYIDPHPELKKIENKCNWNDLLDK